MALGRFKSRLGEGRARQSCLPRTRRSRRSHKTVWKAPGADGGRRRQTETARRCFAWPFGLLALACWPFLLKGEGSREAEREVSRRCAGEAAREGEGEKPEMSLENRMRGGRRGSSDRDTARGACWPACWPLAFFAGARDVAESA